MRRERGWQIRASRESDHRRINRAGMRLEELGLGSEATAARNTKPVDRGCKLTVKKIYAVGLEMVCPGGACHWAPEIPSGLGLAGFAPSKYEPVHKWWTFLADRAWLCARRSSAETCQTIRPGGIRKRVDRLPVGSTLFGLR